MPVTNSTSKPTSGQPYRVVTVASVPLDQAFVGRLGQGVALPAARSLPVGMSEEPMGFASSADWDSGEFKASKKAGQRSNRAVRGVKGVWA
jgi:hypothetical protein